MDCINIYKAFVKAGCTIDHQASDLYVKKDEKSTPIVEKFAGRTVSIFSQGDGEIWYDIPFMYMPYWEKKCKVKI